MFDKKKEMLEKELNDEKQKLEEQIEYAKYQHETELLRESEYLIYLYDSNATVNWYRVDLQLKLYLKLVSWQELWLLRIY